MNRINSSDKELKEYLRKKWDKNEQLYEILWTFTVEEWDKIYEVEEIKYPAYKTVVHNLKSVRKKI